jgi:hypothetical protein
MKRRKVAGWFSQDSLIEMKSPKNRSASIRTGQNRNRFAAVAKMAWVNYAGYVGTHPGSA